MFVCSIRQFTGLITGNDKNWRKQITVSFLLPLWGYDNEQMCKDNKERMFCWQTEKLSVFAPHHLFIHFKTFCLFRDSFLPWWTWGLPCCVTMVHWSQSTVMQGVVEGLFGVFQDVVEIWHATLKHRAEVSRDEGPPDCWGGKQGVTYIALYLFDVFLNWIDMSLHVLILTVCYTVHY